MLLSTLFFPYFLLGFVGLRCFRFVIAASWVLGYYT